jgi:hypothetical protein
MTPRAGLHGGLWVSKIDYHKPHDVLKTSCGLLPIHMCKRDDERCSITLHALLEAVITKSTSKCWVIISNCLFVLSSHNQHVLC